MYCYQQCNNTDGEPRNDAIRIEMRSLPMNMFANEVVFFVCASSGCECV